MLRRPLLALALFAGCASEGGLAAAKGPDRGFLEKHCFACHDSDDPQGKLDLSTLAFDAKSHPLWVKVHDRVRDGEMPPKKKPERGDVDAFLRSLSEPLAAADLAREASEGRGVMRRLNRLEFENSVRDLLQMPWLRIKEMLPEDGEAHRFNKSGEALDVSHVQMAGYLAAAEHALREAASTERPETRRVRYHARDMRTFARRMVYSEFNRQPERATFPVLGFEGQPDVRMQAVPISDSLVRHLEAVGVVAGAYEPLEPKFDVFVAPRAGRYRLRLCGYSIWVGPGKDARWWKPDIDRVSKGRRAEPVTLYAELPPHALRRLAAFDLPPDPAVVELDAFLLEGETIRPDASRLFRSRPPGTWRNPLAEKDGSPGVAYRWLEVEGPLVDAWPTPAYRLLFGDGTEDVEKLLRGFLAKAYRRPPTEGEIARFAALAKSARAKGASFADGMIAAYAAALCSPGFVCLEETPGLLDRDALVARLSYFLWNSPPDEALRTSSDPLAQVERLLDDPRSARFINAFLDYWLDLRRIDATSPDAELYPDYYLDDLLQESAVEETRAYFTELVRGDLPARHVAASDFAMLNERLAAHYGVPGVEGVSIRRVPLPAGSPRGGLLAQASVLKVTANGTTTSPVLRGVWVMERLIGKPPGPPPPGVPAVEPDIRGAETIREQLDKHRADKGCASCHAKIDPPGFALESFDVFGGWRERYRALGEGTKEIGWGKNGQPFPFHLAQPVDASGATPEGAFQDIHSFRRLLLKDERQLARNLAGQLITYATGTPPRFGDRARVEAILDRVAPGGYGVRSLIREIARSEMFRRK